jgi:DNA-binding IscR family transcriptional regulator
MNINLSAYDAVEIMVWLATADRSATSAELADAIGRSPSSTEALLIRLRSGKLVKTVSGHRVGYRLTRPAALISVADVFEAVSRGKSDPGLAAISPDLRPGDAVTGVNLLRTALKNYILIYLRGVRLAELLPDAATTHAGIEQDSFAEPSHPPSDELH